MSRMIVLSDPFNDPDDGEHVEFRLSYRGPLRATQRDPKDGSSVPTRHWQLKHAMRLAFHPQLKRLWESTPFLSEEQGKSTGKPYNVAALAAANTIPPWSFVPLVTEELDVILGLDVMLLRKDHPGASVWSGDIENRIKSLIDALEVPNANDGYSGLAPKAGETPLYCLMQNDKLLNNLTVSTDQLLEVPENSDQSYAHVLITVKTRPRSLTWSNINF